MGDRFGLGWRPPLGAAILRHRDRIDIVEVIADDWLDRSWWRRRALRTLARQIPVALHGIKMGLASTARIEPRRCHAMAALVCEVAPEFWSEHLAFVRGGGVEIGHLAAPPRNDATLAGAVTNLRAATRTVGSPPLVENVATLIDPPGSTMDEATWVGAILRESGADLLLDLHNLYANAVNFGFDPLGYLDALPREQIAAIHLAGGRRTVGGRVLDDHLHDVPEPVYGLLEEVALRVTRPLTVIVERDGLYPPFEQLLGEVERARDAVARGRERRQRLAA